MSLKTILVRFISLHNAIFRRDVGWLSCYAFRIVVVLGGTLIACAIPAHRSATVDAVDSLRVN